MWWYFLWKREACSTNILRMATQSSQRRDGKKIPRQQTFHTRGWPSPAPAAPLVTQFSKLLAVRRSEWASGHSTLKAPQWMPHPHPAGLVAWLSPVPIARDVAARHAGRVDQLRTTSHQNIRRAWQCICRSPKHDKTPMSAWCCFLSCFLLLSRLHCLYPQLG